MQYPWRSLFLARGNSMSPALEDGDLILLAPTLRKRASYRRGALVVARLPTTSAPGAAGSISVKRVVGLPGEYVRVDHDGSVWIEGELLREPYLTLTARAAPGPELSWPCDRDEYLLMGDNRADSWDSRQIGPAPVSEIIGKVWLKAPTHSLLGRKTPGSTRSRTR